MKRRTRSFRSRPTRSAGSALLVALMVMLAVTLLALGLVALTDSERELGAVDRVDTPTFYAAESGVSVSTARVLDGAFAPSRFLIKEPGPNPLQLGYTVDVSRAAALTFSACDFCTVNEDDSSWSYKVTYLVNSEASRRDWESIDPAGSGTSSGAVLGRKVVSSTFEIQPSEPPRLSSAVTLDEEKERLKQ